MSITPKSKLIYLGPKEGFYELDRFSEFIEGKGISSRYGQISKFPWPRTMNRPPLIRRWTAGLFNVQVKWYDLGDEVSIRLKGEDERGFGEVEDIINRAAVIINAEIAALEILTESLEEK